jgi:hypothetical protein
MPMGEFRYNCTGLFFRKVAYRVCDVSWFVEQMNFRIKLYSWHFFVKSEALKAVTVKAAIFQDLTRCSLVDVYRRFGATYCPHLQS